VSGATTRACGCSNRADEPGLSVIIRRDQGEPSYLQRMNSYAIYRMPRRCAAVLHDLAILVFNFLSVTAVMIVMLALLKRRRILSIAYDTVQL